jgi:hypothetical protein
MHEFGGGVFGQILDMYENLQQKLSTGKHIFDLNENKFLNIKSMPAELRDFIWYHRITCHQLAPQKTVCCVLTGCLSFQLLAYRKEARIVVDGALKAEVREPPGPVRALHLTSDLVVGEYSDV